MKVTDLAQPRIVLPVNLKSYFSIERSGAWAATAAKIAADHPVVRSGFAEVALLPSVAALPACLAARRGVLALGAQDISDHPHGAYTGEVIGADLVELGCRYALVGHRDLRAKGHTSDVVRTKLRAALRDGLIPILCVGEDGRVGPSAAAEMCVQRLEAELAGIPPDAMLVVAYEPGWAIGAHSPASVEHIATVCERLRGWLADHKDACTWRVIYGGSAGAGLIVDLRLHLDGLFLGRRVHDPVALTEVLDEVRMLQHGLREGCCDV